MKKTLTHVLFACSITVSLVIVASLASCSSGKLPVRPADVYLASEARSLAASLTTEQKASQVLMTGIYGKAFFSSALYGNYRGTVPGSILLFKHNVTDSAPAMRGFLKDCDRAFFALGSPVPPLYAIDCEGGDVFRTGSITARIPSAERVARSLSPERAGELYRASALELALLGIGLNLAPVAETLTKDNGAFLGTRSFSENPVTVARYAAAAVAGYRAGGVACALKHFPGNGAGDPHQGLPRLIASRAELERTYVAPFREAIKAKPDAILVSHVIVTAIDPERPFCLSQKGVTGLLRNELKFSGLVITDDLAMSALSGNGYPPSAAALAALKAGCDLVMTSAPDIRTLSATIAREAERDPAFMRRLDEAVGRILAVKARHGALWTAHERLALSRSGGSLAESSALEALRNERFIAARGQTRAILGEINGK